MNRKGNMIFGFIFFMMFLAIMVAFIGPINEMLELAQQSDNLNCKGFIYEGNANNVLSFNGTASNNQSGSPIACWMLKLYMPYLVLGILILGMSAILGGRAEQMLGFGGPNQNY